MSYILKNFGSSKPSTIYSSRGKNKGSDYDVEANYEYGLNFYKKERLNQQQRELFDWVIDNPSKIALLQAGPGK